MTDLDAKRLLYLENQNKRSLKMLRLLAGILECVLDSGEKKPISSEVRSNAEVVLLALATADLDDIAAEV